MRSLILIPFHDWRKCRREGFRTRDAHLVEAFTRGGDFDRVLFVSRPLTRLELALRADRRDTELSPVLRGSRWHVLRDPRGFHVFEYFDPAIAGQVLKRKAWFFEAYGSREMALALLKACEGLGMGETSALSMNIRSARLAARLRAGGIPVAFDAWDNWLRFPLRGRERRYVRESYSTFAEIAPLWFTNSEANRATFEEEFGVRGCTVVPNGVDPERFQGEFEEPAALREIPRPRALFGGKVTHLFDAGLFNDVVRLLPETQFVLAGPILDRRVWGAIEKRRNVHYLGDVHYDQYPAYVAASDVCILPYVSEEKSHGANSIKLYEYAAARRPTVSTGANGAAALSALVSIANSPEEFARAIERCIESGASPPELPAEFSWDERARTMAGHVRGMAGGGSNAVSPSHLRRSA